MCIHYHIKQRGFSKATVLCTRSTSFKVLSNSLIFVGEGKTIFLQVMCMGDLLVALLVVAIAIVVAIIHLIHLIPLIHLIV